MRLASCEGATTRFGDTNWKDKLTSYDGSPITYDEIGNPLSYRGSNFVWDGRQLTQATKGNESMAYVYGVNGMRLQKTYTTPTKTVTTSHTTDGAVIYADFEQTVENGETTDEYRAYFYDESGSPVGFMFHGQNYYFEKTLQGDISRIYDSEGNVVGEYLYDAWGNLLNADSLTEIAKQNPFRYRGYYFDSETGLYYVSSRYYDPQVGRFINVDDTGYLGADGSVLSYNLFAYCMNDPVNRVDDGGNWSIWATIGVAVGAAICVAAISILTCGVGTATLAGAIAVGASKGALIGAAIGTAIGAGIGYAATGTLNGTLEGAAIGFGAGATIGTAIGGKIGKGSWYQSMASEFTNVGANEVVLGRSGNYEAVAQSRGSTYFHTTDTRWDEVRDMVGVGNKGMWNINKTFLDQQISAGSTFALANNPVTSGGYYFKKEVAYLASKGISMLTLF